MVSGNTGRRSCTKKYKRRTPNEQKKRHNLHEILGFVHHHPPMMGWVYLD
jgi:hypothetical protein